MEERYIDLANISHLDRQSKGTGVFGDPKWRESYYYCMTDRSSGVSLITTIGMLPNRKRSHGFVMLFRDGKVAFLKPLVAFRIPRSDGYTFRLKGLEYSVEGAGWRLRYRSKKCSIDVLFSPVNRIYPYITGEADRIFARIGSQHYEQSGTYEGRITLRGETIAVGPCFGHRDHSWGIRDWGGVEVYRLFCCTFSKELAFNLWEGTIGKRPFLKGYVFDGKSNTPIVRSRVSTKYGKDGRMPVSASLRLEDEKGRKYEVRCNVLSGVAVPVTGSLLHETVARMECGGQEGAGLLEYLYHEERRVPRMRAYLKVLGIMGGN
jgi:hypothetical protein